MLYEWIVKGDGRDIHQISNERVLRIAKRSALLKYDVSIFFASVA